MEAIGNVVQNEKSDQFLESLVLGVVEHQQEIDELLRNHLEKWTLDRVATVDRVILRIAVYEMKYEEEIPTSVTLNEAIELAKTFGDDQSSKFINGVLSKVLTTLSK
jgi:N utilization substance protein B